MKITRDVVNDLWPLVVAGEASPDSRTLVDEFLRGDPDFAARLEQAKDVALPSVTMPPDREARALSRTRDLVSGGRWLRILRLFAAAMTGLAILHFAQSGVKPPLQPVLEAAVAATCWIAYALILRTVRARALRTA